MRLLCIIASIYFIIYSTRIAAEQSESLIIGTTFKYEIQPGDYLIKIGARYGVDSTYLSRSNDLKYDDYLLPGQELVIDNRHIVPYVAENGLLINLPQRMLYYFQDGNLTEAYPVGLGKQSWPTPVGEFSVVEKATNKPWLVPKSIQEEMKREGRIVITRIPPGLSNPLGKHWIGLSLLAIGIHGTIAPSSVYKFQSHGCIRVHPDDIAKLYEKIPIGSTGNIVYMPILLAESDGKIYLEVHRDIYHKYSNSIAEVEKLALNKNISNKIDWMKANRVFELQEGVASDITLSANVIK